MKKINLKGINETIYKETLTNGLEVYLLPNNNVKNFYMTFSTKYGSLYTTFKDENDTSYKSIPNGVAHFLEHLTFKMEDGSDASEYFAKLGSNCNAYTSFKVTCYEVYAYNNFKENLNYLLDYVQTPCYNEKIVEAEKGIICEEVKMYEDNPNMNLTFEMNKCLFKNENYRNQVGGTVKDVKSTTLKNINDEYNMFYHPSNMFVIITGNFNLEEAISIIIENQENKKFTKKVKPVIKKIHEPVSIVCDYKEIKTNVEIPKVNIGLKIPLKNFETLKLNREELSIYLSIILNCNFGNSSILKEQLVSGNIITDGIIAQKYFTDDYLIINIISETPYPKRYIDLVTNQLSKLVIDEDDLIRKKRVAISNLIQATDDIEEMSYSIQSDIINYGKVIDNVYNIYNNLNLDRCKKIISKITTKNMATLVLLPKN